MRCDAGFHVGGTATGDAVAAHLRGHERQMDRVEMAIELEGSTRSAAGETHGDRRSRHVASAGAFDRETVEQQAQAATNWPKTHYTKREIQIPMRDGTKLYTAVYTKKAHSTMYRPVHRSCARTVGGV